MLDNCEQLLPAAAPEIADLLQHTAHVHVLATSRTPLHVYGEHEYSVPPLGLPQTGHGGDLAVDQAEAYAALQVFVARGQAVQWSFSLRPENISTVVEICRRLNDLPLAIELAAALLAKLNAPLPML